MSDKERAWVKKHISETVDAMLEKYTGGTRFFDALDAHWRFSKDGWRVVDYFAAEADRDLAVDGYISTGRFGMFLHNRYGALWPALILVTGGLRSGAPMDRLDYLRDELKNRVFCILDDSHFSGRTRSMITAEVERLGGSVVQTCVIYDGCKEDEDDVFSFYRYYDHYDPQPWSRNPNVKKVKK